MKRVAKRVVYRIGPGRPYGGWAIRIFGLPNSRGSRGPLRHWRKTQAEAIAFATGGARLTLNAGELAQVVLHGRDGRIRWERTYGADPKRSKG